jgi:2-methylisocitrate lyase-like PEP mutase family enzyme
MRSQLEKGEVFHDLHVRAGIFIIPNPWDVGTARILVAAGFGALATTSAGYAFARGLPDGSVGRGEMLRHVAEVVGASSLPVSADLEAGYGSSPEEVAMTIRLAATAGAVGGSIEDTSGDKDRPLLDIQAASERIRAAAEEAARLPFPFMLTARAENFLVGRPDLRETIARLQAYQEAGANVLYAPGLTRKEDIATIVRSVDRPLNVVIGLTSLDVSLEQLQDIGVKRVSLGSALSRVAFAALLGGLAEMRGGGTFGFLKGAVPFAELNSLFRDFQSRVEQSAKDNAQY